MKIKDYMENTELNNYTTVNMVKRCLDDIDNAVYRVELKYLLRIIDEQDMFDDLFDYVDRLINRNGVEDIDCVYNLLHSLPEFDFDYDSAIMYARQ